MIFKRELYLSQIRPYYDMDLIKVLTGIRRSGKSMILRMIMKELLQKGVGNDHIIFMNLEDMSFSNITDALALHEYIKSKIADSNKYYILIDEVQYVDKFEKALSSFKATLNCSIFVTGSNSTLLSGELATLLTGRTKEFKILPFSYKEAVDFLKFRGAEVPRNFFYDYLKWGGFPQRFDMFDEMSVYSYLSDLYNSIKYKDIVSKNSLDKNKFDKFASYILSNCGSTFTPDNIVNYDKANNSKGKAEVSKSTLYSYSEYLERAYLINKIQRFDISGKKVLITQEKYYASDMGLCTINTNTLNFQDTFFLENVIYLELLRRNYLVFIGKTFKGEVDFVAVRQSKKCFIQISYLLNSEKTIEREFSAFDCISDNSPKYVFSLDEIDFSRNGITHINIIDFLLGEKDITLS